MAFDYHISCCSIKGALEVIEELVEIDGSGIISKSYLLADTNKSIARY